MMRNLVRVALLAALIVCCRAEAEPEQPPPVEVAPDPLHDVVPELLTEEGEGTSRAAPAPDAPATDAPSSAEAEPPCGDVAPRTWTIRWRKLPASSGVTGYVLLRGPAGAALLERIPLAYTETADPPNEPILSALVEGFNPAHGWSTALVAVSESGESAPSNQLTIPRQVSGPCAPEGQPPLPPPTILDIMVYLSRIEQRATEVGAEARVLRQRIESEGMVSPVHGSP